MVVVVIRVSRLMIVVILIVGVVYGIRSVVVVVGIRI